MTHEKDMRMTLDALPQFMEWGGKYWLRLVKHAVEDFIGPDLSGRRVLELGSSNGRMAVFFALLGADVTGVDIDGTHFTVGQNEARQRGVAERVHLIEYEGNLDVLPDGAFDVIFSKSVLVMVPRLDQFLCKLNIKVATGGKVVFLENARGNRVLHALRPIYYRLRNYPYHKVQQFFSVRELNWMRQAFEIDSIESAPITRPGYLIMGHKREQS